MSLAIASRSSRADNQTLRLFCRSLLVTLAAMTVGCLMYLVEKYWVMPRRRFIENPADVMVRAFALAHFLVGWLFLITSPRLRHPLALLRLAGLLGLGALACLGFLEIGGAKNPLALMAFYSCFLFHDLGDQVRLFQRQPDAPLPTPGRKRLLSALQWFAILVMMTTLAGFNLLSGYARGKSPVFVEMTPWVPIGLWAGLLLATGLAGVWLGHWIRLESGSVGEFARAYGPLLWIFTILLGVLTIGSLLGSVGLNLVILMHVATWLVHVHHELSARRPTTPSRWWQAWRQTPGGFVALHLLMVGVVLAFLSLRVQVWERSGWTSTLFAASSFPLWSLVHIATSFWRGK